MTLKKKPEHKILFKKKIFILGLVQASVQNNSQSKECKGSEMLFKQKNYSEFEYHIQTNLLSKASSHLAQ